MKKLIICLAAALSVNCLNAQTVTETSKKVEANRFFDSWFISVGGGAQVYIYRHQRKQDAATKRPQQMDNNKLGEAILDFFSFRRIN